MLEAFSIFTAIVQHQNGRNLRKIASLTESQAKVRNFLTRRCPSFRTSFLSQIESFLQNFVRSLTSSLYCQCLRPRPVLEGFTYE